MSDIAGEGSQPHHGVVDILIELIEKLSGWLRQHMRGHAETMEPKSPRNFLASIRVFPLFGKPRHRCAEMTFGDDCHRVIRCQNSISG